MRESPAQFRASEGGGQEQPTSCTLSSDGPAAERWRMKSAHLSAATLLVLNLLLLTGQVGFGKAAALYMDRLPGFDVTGNPWYLATLLCLLAQAFVWPLVLKRVPLSFAYSFGALQYPVTLLISRAVFGERITSANVIGSGLIVAGILVWARGRGRKPCPR